MQFWLLSLLLLAGCAGKPPVPHVDFLYKGMNRQLMLHVMGEPVQILKTYPGGDTKLDEERQYQFSNSKCVGERTSVCTVSLTKDGIVFAWSGIKISYTEDGQK